ncbi:serine/threonine-protein kinase EDR1 [Elaeis guineensis]|uniref:non-specific serine/threonine protein kinase n=1 Tax=Elaeis guineensis var. tenera TaxID=51953 RepID=A0A6I9QZ52_ELAGV|nr:serine/threonine-protein kinase EDR1 [Elaeis guineensis]
MKNIFKIHKKNPHRSNEIAPSSASAASATATAASPSPAALSPSCASDHRAAAQGTGATPSPPSPSPPAEAARPTTGDRQDYFSSEEEFQVQLALAISASKEEFRADPDGDQIRAAKLLSLGGHRMDQDREDGTADSLSRRYWDYNVLDYNEKVADGFYDIFRLASDYSSQGKMPSLVDLQTSIGDLGFEVIIVNRSIDTALLELEQIAQCISLDCPVADTGLLVQRISELVTEHMGGPVKDAGDMLARWMEKSTELRTSQQTSLLLIGCIKVGLSRHRALLFKVLADNVGIPCKLVKGSHYTGVDDDAVNIIKLGDGREFLVDLMAAPGTLIPADVLSVKDAALNSNVPRLNKNATPWTANSSLDNLSRAESSFGQHIGGHHTGGNGSSALSDNKHGEAMQVKTIVVPSVQNASAVTSSGADGCSSSGNTNLFLQNQSNQLSCSTSATSSKQKGVIEVPVDGDSLRNEKLSTDTDLQDTADSTDPFADLNPFQVVGIGKNSAPFRATDIRNTGYQRRRESIVSGPGRPQRPLVWKGQSACNEVPSTKQHNFVDGPFPRKKYDLNASSSQVQSSAGNIHSKGSNDNIARVSSISCSSGVDMSGNEMTSVSTQTTACPSSGLSKSSISSEKNQHSELERSYVNARTNKPFTQSSEAKYKGNDHAHELVSQSSMPYHIKEGKKNVIGKRDLKYQYDRSVGAIIESKDQESSNSPSQVRPSRLDPMLDDVSEWEILWEDLVIGERIGLGSYGEVYRADWNGTEVAVKKFLDQDFYGDALDEFRSEVRIMRRLRHPNVVLFMGAVTRPPNLSIVSEFLPRGSLYRILHRPNCQIDEKRRIKMALDVAKGMNCLHTSVPTIVHRDLKSPNLLVDKNWTVKVCDFGLSRLKHNTFLSSKSTAGTPEWMAPEVLRNEPSNEKCDVYSFGVILWELATLRMPWSGMNPMQVVGAVGFQERRLDIPKEVDPLVARIIWECWQTDPSLRPSFAQLTTALKSLQRLVIPSHQDTQSPPVAQEISVNSTP